MEIPMKRSLLLCCLITATLFAQAQTTTRTGGKPPKAPAAAAEPAAPQPETALKWLQATYRTHGTVISGDWRFTEPDMTFSGCVVKFTTFEKWPGAAPPFLALESFDLQDLSAEIAMKGSFDWVITLKTKDGSKKIKREYGWGKREISSNNTVSIHLDDEGISKRAANAFRDAILACGGSKEAY